MFKWGFIAPLTLILGSCYWHNEGGYHDAVLQLSPHEYKQTLTDSSSPAPHKLISVQTKKQDQTSIPHNFLKPVSVSTTDAVPLKDLLLSMAQQANVNLFIAHDIKGTITLHAQNRPLLELIQELCDSHGLRFKMCRQLMKIEVDRPYLEAYPLDFLILSRSNINRFSIATDVFTGPEGQHSDEENSSNTLLTAETKTDFWQELTENLAMHLSIGTVNDNENNSASRFSIHKQAGIISVFGTAAQHHQIKSYLENLRLSVEKQVLIEAKILEVHLKDECKSGINWDVVRGSFVMQAPLGSIVTPGPFNKDTPPHRNIFTIGGGNKDITGIISALNRFGTVRTLSNPRLTVINNQSAVLKVATNKVYFKLNYTCDYNYFDKREQIYVSSDAKTVPIGLVMIVQPSISHKDDKIIMTVRPTISRVIQEVPDPAVGIASHQKQTSYVPEVQVRELDSVLSMSSGETIVVGGLMEDRADHDTSQVSGLSSLPLLGSLFKSQSHDQQVTELVIFLRAIILEPSQQHPQTNPTSIHPADERNYHTFTQDPRPLTF
jgi:MSHA type pilus biogenesis protein MshL